MPSLFANTHNVVAILEKSNVSEGFAQIIDFLSGSYIHYALTVFANMRRVGKGFSGVETPLFENMLEVREVYAEEEVQQVLDKCSALVLRVEGLETANTAQQLEILKLKARVKRLKRLNKVKSSKLRHLKKVSTSQRIESSEDLENVFNQERINVDIDEGIELVVDQEKDAEIEGRQADTQAEIYNIDLDHSSKVLSTQENCRKKRNLMFKLKMFKLKGFSVSRDIMDTRRSLNLNLKHARI
nr:hypothetical protein [Tanacetum cinerariifolium]